MLLKQMRSYLLSQKKRTNEIQQKIFNGSELENIHQWLDDNFNHLAHMNDFKLILFPL